MKTRSNKYLLKLIKNAIKEAKPDLIQHHIWYVGECRFSGLCTLVSGLNAMGTISSIETYKLQELIYSNRPDKAMGSLQYWFSIARKEWKKQRIAFINNLIEIENGKAKASPVR